MTEGELKCTEYFRHTRIRPDRRQISDEWIHRAITNPIRRERQSDGRFRLWAYITEADRYLRVILLEDGETVHNAFFDRSFKESAK